MRRKERSFGLVVASIAVAPLIAFAFIWASLLFLIFCMWSLEVIGML